MFIWKHNQLLAYCLLKQADTIKNVANLNLFKGNKSLKTLLFVEIS